MYTVQQHFKVVLKLLEFLQSLLTLELSLIPNVSQWTLYYQSTLTEVYKQRVQ